VTEAHARVENACLKRIHVVSIDMNASKEKRYCFFGTPYRGDHCKCGWTEDLLTEVPEEYNEGGHLKAYQTTHYKIKGTHKLTSSAYLI
jgi:hypothetical protein